MDRRTFIIGLGSILLAAPLAAEAQAAKVLRIGFLTPVTAEEAAPFITAFRQGLRELGYVEGQNVGLESRFGDGRLERLPGLAADPTFPSSNPPSSSW